jgi:hypothetical protein
MAISLHNTPPDHGTVIRITSHKPLQNYTLIRASEPLHVRQYCRTLTPAQGRILYEVWTEDEERHWHPRCVGYVVPSHLTSEGLKEAPVLRRGAEEWKGLPSVVVRRYEEAWGLLWGLGLVCRLLA